MTSIISISHFKTQFIESFKESYRKLSLPSDPLRVLSLLTLFLVLLHGPKVWAVAVPTKCLALIGVLSSNVWKRPLFWFSMTLFLGLDPYLNYHTADNHKYLFAYWSFSFFMASLNPKFFQEVLRTNGGLLCSLAMLFAILWKGFLATEFAEGSFMGFTLIDDGRFQNFTQFFTGLTIEQLQENKWLKNTLLKGNFSGVLVEKVQLNGNQKLVILSKIITYWTLLIESLIGISFLFPKVFKNFRHGFLVLFILTTYPVATVTGFGWLLAVLGMASINDTDKQYWAPIYLGCIFCLHLFAIPYGDLFFS